MLHTKIILGDSILCQEEEEKKRKEEQERLEHEEYLRLKESFSVEGEGSGEQAIQEEVNLSHKFYGEEL